MKDKDQGTTAMQARYYFQLMLPHMKYIEIIDHFTKDGKWEGFSFMCEPVEFKEQDK